RRAGAEPQGPALDGRKAAPSGSPAGPRKDGGGGLDQTIAAAAPGRPADDARRRHCHPRTGAHPRRDRGAIGKDAGADAARRPAMGPLLREVAAGSGAPPRTGGALSSARGMTDGPADARQRYTASQRQTATFRVSHRGYSRRRQKHDDERVATCPRFQPDVDRPHLKMHGLTLAKGPLDDGKILITVVDNIFGSCRL